MSGRCYGLGSAGILPAVSGILPEALFGTMRMRRGARQDARAPLLVLIIAFFAVIHAPAATLQERIAAAAPNDTIRVAAGVHAGPMLIDKLLTLAGEPGAEIRGNGAGKVITISADDVIVTGLRVT
nr:hypothetical protein [Chthoniobacterales bacterium]